MKSPIIFFDGTCNLCSETVQFVIKHDKKKLFRFASLQSTIGQHLLDGQRYSKSNLQTLILLQEDIIYTRSTAVLRISRHLDGFWPILYLLIIIPPIIRNSIYSLIARNRYRLFGKKKTCWMPTPEYMELFNLSIPEIDFSDINHNDSKSNKRFK